MGYTQRLLRIGLGIAFAAWAVYATALLLDLSYAGEWWINQIAPIAVPVAAGAACARAATRRRDEAVTWLLLSSGALAWAAGDTVYTVYDVLGVNVTGSLTPADIGYLALIPLWFAAIVLHPIARERGLEVVGTSIDALTVLVVAATATISFVLLPILRGAVDSVGTATLLAYPIGDLALMTGLARLVSRSTGRLGPAELLIGAGVVLFAAGDILYTWLGLQDGYEAGQAVDLSWQIAFIAIILATRQRMAVRPATSRLAGPILSAAGLVAVATLAGLALLSRERLVLLTGAVVAGLCVAARQTALLVENRRRAASYETLLQVIGDLGEGFIITDAMKVTYVNQAFCDMSGYTADELYTMGAMDIVTADHWDESASRWRRRLEGVESTDHYEMAIVHKSGRRVELEAAVKAIARGDRLETITLCRDITERKRVQRELEELAAAKSEFIAHAAHELRTPLTAIAGTAATLMLHRERLSESQLDDLVKVLYRHGERSRTLMDNLLDLSQLEEHHLTMQLEHVEVGTALKEALEAAPPPEGVRVEVEAQPDLRAIADPMRLEQVLVNLLTNAYRYGGKAIRLEGFADGDRAALVVSDDGHGVPSELVPLMFEPFRRGSAVGRTPGSGLGLTIARRLVEEFGGSMRYEPGEARGARFVIRLKTAKRRTGPGNVET